MCNETNGREGEKGKGRPKKLKSRRKRKSKTPPETRTKLALPLFSLSPEPKCSSSMAIPLSRSTVCCRSVFDSHLVVRPSVPPEIYFFFFFRVPVPGVSCRSPGKGQRHTALRCAFSVVLVLRTRRLLTQPTGSVEGPCRAKFPKRGTHICMVIHPPLHRISSGLTVAP
jgi:hypothetical protein